MLLAESYLLYMSTKRTLTGNLRNNWRGSNKRRSKNLRGPRLTEAPS